MRTFLMDSLVVTASHSRKMEPFLALKFFTPVGLPVLLEEEEEEVGEEDWTEEELLEEDWVVDELELEEETTLAR